MSNVDMRVTLAGMTMKNPVVVASGTFGFGREYSQFFDLSELGGICAKGLTLLPRELRGAEPFHREPPEP